MRHREERELHICLHLSADFDESYEGDDDGYAWHDQFERELRPRLLAAVFEVLRGHPRFRALPAPRGRNPSDAVDIDVAYQQAPTKTPGDR